MAGNHPSAHRYCRAFRTKAPGGHGYRIPRSSSGARTSYKQVVQANALVGVAKANLFPQITLTGSGGGASPELSAFTNVWALAAGLTGCLPMSSSIRPSKVAGISLTRGGADHRRRPRRTR